MAHWRYTQGDDDLTGRAVRNLVTVEGRLVPAVTVVGAASTLPAANAVLPQRAAAAARVVSALTSAGAAVPAAETGVAAAPQETPGTLLPGLRETLVSRVQAAARGTAGILRARVV